MAVAKFSAPGRFRADPMSTGRVVVSARARKLVAPNSPRAMTKANPPAAPIDLPTIGRSTVAKTRNGVAPNVAAACRNRTGTDSSAGIMMRMTTGIAMRAWTSGMTAGDAAISYGNDASTMR